MRIPDPLIRSMALAAALINLFALFYFGVRPWYLHWGASAEEVARALPGDDVVPNPRRADDATRAITIHAPASQVWPWIAQLGQDRAGFYSYVLLEDLVGCQMPSADRVHPEYQRWQLGDKLWMYPPDKLDGLGHALLVRLEPGRALAFATRQIGTTQPAPYDGSWTFVLEPLDAHRSRLLVRGRAAGPRPLFGAAFDHFVFEPLHFMMERKMLESIKTYAEGGRTSLTWDNAQLLTYALAFMLMLCSAGLLLVRERWSVPLAAFIAASAAFQLLTLLQPSPVLGLVLVVVLASILLVPRHKPSSPRATPVRRHEQRTGSVRS